MPNRPTGCMEHRRAQHGFSATSVMSHLRLKTILVLIVTIAILITVLNLAVITIVSESFAKIEVDQSAQNIPVVKNANSPWSSHQARDEIRGPSNVVLGVNSFWNFRQVGPGSNNRRCDSAERC